MTAVYLLLAVWLIGGFVFDEVERRGGFDPWQGWTNRNYYEPANAATPSAVDALPAKWLALANKASGETGRHGTSHPLLAALRAEAITLRQCANELTAALAQQPAAPLPAEGDKP